ncbi:MAG: hypothetical protein WBP93_18525 [Pyrinomonadaceae bacterium]
MPRKLTEATEFQAKIGDYQGVVRGKIPSPLVRVMGARPGDYMNFRLIRSGEAIMRVSRSRSTGKGTKRSTHKVSKRA